MTASVIATSLGETPPFSNLDGQTLADLARGCQIRHLRPRQLLFCQGDPGHAAYVVITGAVTLTWGGRDGETLTVRSVRPGELFGELALIDGSPRSATAEATEATTLLVVPAVAWGPLLTHPSFTAGLLRDLVAGLRHSTRLLAEHALMDLTGRVAAALLRLTDGEEQSGVLRTRAVTQVQLAAMVAGSRQSVNQVLGMLERRGDICTTNGHIVLLRPDALRRRSEI